MSSSQRVATTYTLYIEFKLNTYKYGIYAFELKQSKIHVCAQTQNKCVSYEIVYSIVVLLSRMKSRGLFPYYRCCSLLIPIYHTRWKLCRFSIPSVYKYVLLCIHFRRYVCLLFLNCNDFVVENVNAFSKM